MSSTLLKADQLGVALKQQGQTTQLIQNLSFQLQKNQCLGIVGESGSGKSITCKAILGLLRPPFQVTGTALYQGEDLLSCSESQMQQLRGKEIVMVLQHPMTAFDPLEPIGRQMTESLRVHRILSEKEAVGIAVEALEKLNIHHPKEVLKKYPHQVSGGMLQRIMVGIALAAEPAIIIADEPTTAVDAVNVATVISLFEQIKKREKTALIFISHDLNVVARLADHLVVMSEGKIVESGLTDTILQEPQHPKTRQLVGTREALMNQFYRYVKWS